MTPCLDVMIMASNRLEGKIPMDWSKITVGSVLAFLVGWLLFGLFGAVTLAIIVLLVMGILKVK